MRISNILLIVFIFMIIGCSNHEEQEGFTPVVFTESDFHWDKEMIPYKEILINQVNMMQYNKKICRDMDTGTLTMSNTKGTKDDPVFFITCGKGAEMQNIYFSKSTAEENLRIHNDLNK